VTPPGTGQFAFIPELFVAALRAPAIGSVVSGNGFKRLRLTPWSRRKPADDQVLVQRTRQGPIKLNGAG
jgi:hypothetical protein